MRASDVLEANSGFLSKIVGELVTRVALDEHAVVILIGSAEIRVEGAWSLLDEKRNMVDEAAALPAREYFQLWRILGMRLAGVHLSDDTRLELILRFELGWELRTLSDDDGLEDWSVTHPDFLLVAEDRHLALFRTGNGCSLPG